MCLQQLPASKRRHLAALPVSLLQLLRYPLLAPAAVSSFLLVPCAGCGSSRTAATQPAPGTPLAIVTQPASQTVPLGQTATFSVVASGSGTLTYQWSRGGVAISGANSPSYTTAPSQLTDSGFEYTVAVSASGNSLNSTQAQLTIGPRSPKPYDIRFQEVDSPAVNNLAPGSEMPGNIVISAGGHSQLTNGAATGTPLQLGPSTYTCDTLVSYPDCAWVFDITALPAGVTGLGVLYTADVYENLTTDLATVAPPSISVVTSLDIQQGSDAFAMAVTGSGSTNGFDVQQEVVTPGALPSTVAADGLKSRVVTAVSLDGAGMVHLLSYGWQADTTTLYDTTTAITPPSGIAAAAQTMAQQGYILTALGGNAANGYVLVGTKVQGDTLPRPLVIVTQAGTQGSSNQGGFAPVGWVQYTASGAAPGTPTPYVLLYEH